MQNRAISGHQRAPCCGASALRTHPPEVSHDYPPCVNKFMKFCYIQKMSPHFTSLLRKMKLNLINMNLSVIFYRKMRFFLSYFTNFYRTQPANILGEEKYIVFESKLMLLFKSCVHCQATNITSKKIRPRSYGSQLKVQVTCHSCHKTWDWHSQPKIGNFMAGNLLLSAAILYGGASPTKVLRVLNHMNLKVISNRTYMEHQRDYLQPATIRIFEREQRQLVNRIPEGEKLTIGGDGRADSPGHSAKYGSYCIMDMNRKKILDVQLVQVRK